MGPREAGPGEDGEGVEYVWRERRVEVGGRSRVYKVFEHPGSVVIVPEQDGKLALVRQYRPAVDAWLWELPAGTLEPGEEPLDAARRELEEETGLSARRLEVVASFFLAPGYSTERMTLVRALELTPVGAHPDEGEMIGEVRWFEPEELLRMAESGQLLDAKTLAALLLVIRGRRPR